MSPYISRGVISTKQVLKHVETLNIPWATTEKFIQELAWRDYWQQIYIQKGRSIESDLKNKQTEVSNFEIPTAVLAAKTGISAVDEAIKQLYATGYMHNHMRMYVAALCCNIAKCHWLTPAKWMYSHLLDGDLASNHLSWQWVAGTFSNKKYVANQDNINRFFASNQKNTFLDIDYSEFEHLKTPKVLRQTEKLENENTLHFPPSSRQNINHDQKTLIYNYYNIDPYWHEGENVQRIYLIEPSFFEAYPIGQNCFDFALALTKNIEGMQIFVGEFAELGQYVDTENIIFKEHPSNQHYKGYQESRDWMSSVTGYYSSFFKFWKKVKKELKPV